ncbi:MAG: glycosyltransferase [Candidatus Zixiibacteriota bacterium]|nr:MAG: glycosyltransferase [candidate division Zixibacteria bacterium]
MLTETSQRVVARLGKADIIIGIPSFNNDGTIGHVVRAVQAGLAKYFPGSKSVIVNADGGSKDGTREVVQRAAIEDLSSILISGKGDLPFRFATPYHGIPGKGSAFREIFAIASELNVRACAVVDSDLRSITPEWIELLVKPILQGTHDYVAPLYKRHKYDGTITNNIIYPLTRALYGKPVRQPIGGDFGFSGSLAKFYLSKNVWETDVARYGIDIWMTTTAIANDFRVCQAFLGAKIHDPKDPAADLSSMLMQVVGATFDLMEEYESVWKQVRGSESISTFGFQYEVGVEPLQVNLDGMLQRFRLGLKELRDIWKIFIDHESIESLQSAAETDNENVRISDETWVRIIYAFAIAYRRRLLSREHLLKSLTPLYLGKVASFVEEAKDMTAGEVEARIEMLCVTYEKSKSLLIDGW